MRALVIDATHGGITISEALIEKGYEVTCVDVYKKLSNIKGLKFEIIQELPNLSNYDLIIKPVHFPLHNFNGKIITHHEAVKMIVSSEIDYPIVEITGSFGKTSAIKCAMELLKHDYKVLSLTSEGIIFAEKGKESIILSNISTTPANIIKAVRLCPKRPDLAIFEVSLGGTGMANLGIIKNVYHNYSIAKGTSSALMAKLSMIKNRRPNSTILLNADDPLLRGFSDVEYFSMYSKQNIYAQDVNITRNGIAFKLIFNGFSTMNGKSNSQIFIEALNGPMGREHVENIMVGASIAKFFGIEEERISIPREVFNGKMILMDSLVLNRSPAINEKVIENSIKEFLELFPPVRLEIGGKLKTSCGFINIEEVARIINNSPFEEVFLFGELGEELKKLVNKRISHDKKLPILRIERE